MCRAVTKPLHLDRYLPVPAALKNVIYTILPALLYTLPQIICYQTRFSPVLLPYIRTYVPSIHVAFFERTR